MPRTPAAPGSARRSTSPDPSSAVRRLRTAVAVTPSCSAISTTVNGPRRRIRSSNARSDDSDIPAPLPRPIGRSCDGRGLPPRHSHNRRDIHTDRPSGKRVFHKKTCEKSPPPHTARFHDLVIGDVGPRAMPEPSSPVSDRCPIDRPNGRAYLRQVWFYRCRISFFGDCAIMTGLRSTPDRLERARRSLPVVPVVRAPVRGRSGGGRAGAVQGGTGGAGVQAPGGIWRGVGAGPVPPVLPLGLRPEVCVLRRRDQRVRSAARAAADGGVPRRGRRPGPGGGCAHAPVGRRRADRSSPGDPRGHGRLRRPAAGRLEVGLPRHARGVRAARRGGRRLPRRLQVRRRCLRPADRGRGKLPGHRDPEPVHGRRAGRPDRAAPAPARPLRLLLPADRRLAAGATCPTPSSASATVTCRAGRPTGMPSSPGRWHRATGHERATWRLAPG